MLLSLTAVVDSIINGTNYTDPEKSLMRIGVDVLPAIPKDTTDRNRTSPLAFTGNKFEFRMLGSSQSIAGPNIALNTIMAEELGKFADILESAPDFHAALQKLVCDTFTEHQRIIFNGNGYSSEWMLEAANRGLSNYPASNTSLISYDDPKNIDLVTRRGIFSREEFHARYQIHLATYAKTIRIEARTMVDMIRKQILPAVYAYTSALAKGVAAKQTLGLPHKAETDLLQRLGRSADRLYETCEALNSHIAFSPEGALEQANYCHDVLMRDMKHARKDADLLEQLTDKSYWPYPTYSDLLFY